MIENVFKTYWKNPYINRLMPKRFFRQMVRQVVIEISSVCNRKCGYCPQSLLTRPAQKMEEVVFEKLVNELVEIGYSNQICLNLFNEPLLYAEHLIEVIDKLKIKLPNSKIMFSTNGDMLTKEILNRLSNSRLDNLYITIHPKDEHKWSGRQVKNEIEKFIFEMDLHNNNIEVFPNSVRYTTKYQSLELEIFSLNFLKVGVNRAGVLSNIESALGANRIKPCYRPSHDFCVSYDGTVYPCCQFYHGLEVNSPFIVGSILESSIFEIFSSSKMETFRKMAMRNGNKNTPCKTCTE